MWLLRRNFRRLLAFAAPKHTMAPNFPDKTFANSHKTTKFMKVFSLKSFPLYGSMRATKEFHTCASNANISYLPSAHESEKSIVYTLSFIWHLTPALSKFTLCSTLQVDQWNAHVCVAAVESGSLRGAAGLEETSEESRWVLVSSGEAYSRPRQGCLLTHWEQRTFAGEVPPSAFPFCKRQKAGRGLGMRLAPIANNSRCSLKSSQMAEW